MRNRLLSDLDATHVHGLASPDREARDPWQGRNRRRRLLRLLALFGAGSIAACGAVAEENADEGLRDLGSTQANLSIQSFSLWPPTTASGKTQIPVCFENGTETERNFVRAIAESSWEAIGSESPAGVDFTVWGDCAPPWEWPFLPPSLKINFSATADTSSTNGLGRNTAWMTFKSHSTQVVVGGARTVRHEFGHALGFTHEFNRGDYQTVDPDCTEDQGTDPDVGLLGPDTGSIMNYPICGASSDLTLQDRISFIALYGPMPIEYNLTVAMRLEGSWAFVRGTSAPTANAAGLPPEADLTLERVSGSTPGISAYFGDKMRIRTAAGQYLRATGSGSGYLVDTTSTPSAATTWEAFSFIANTPIDVNEQVVLKANDGRFLGVNGAGRLMTTEPSGAAGWRFIRLPSPTHWN